MRKSSYISSLLLAIAMSSASVMAASFPTSGYDGSGESYELIVAQPLQSSTMLSAIYDYDAAVNHHGSAVGDFGLIDPLLYNNGYRFEQFQLTPGLDQIYADGPGALGVAVYNLVHSSQYGWLVIDWNNDGLDAFDEDPNNYQGIYVDYFLLPLGNGEYILICLALLYASFLVYRNYIKKKSLVV